VPAGACEDASVVVLCVLGVGLPKELGEMSVKGGSAYGESAELSKGPEAGMADVQMTIFHSA